jgi:hypothetical protein
VGLLARVSIFRERTLIRLHKVPAELTFGLLPFILILYHVWIVGSPDLNFYFFGEALLDLSLVILKLILLYFVNRMRKFAWAEFMFLFKGAISPFN